MFSLIRLYQIKDGFMLFARDSSTNPCNYYVIVSLIQLLVLWPNLIELEVDTTNNITEGQVFQAF